MFFWLQFSLPPSVVLSLYKGIEAHLVNNGHFWLQFSLLWRAENLPQTMRNQRTLGNHSSPRASQRKNMNREQGIALGLLILTNVLAY